MTPPVTKDISQVLGCDAATFINTLSRTRPKWITGSLSVSDALFVFESAIKSGTGVAVEVGTASGYSSTVLCHALHTASRMGAIGPDFRVLSYDISPVFYADPSKRGGDAAREQLPPELLEHVTFRSPVTAADLRSLHGESGIEFLFIDADHRHPWPALDLLAAVDALKPGATVLLHDINLPVIHPQHPDWGAKRLFDGLDLEKDAAVNPYGPPNTGKIIVPADKGVLKAQLLDIIARHAWEVEVPANHLRRIGVPDRKRTQKLSCSVKEHRSLEDCLAWFEDTKDPQDCAPEALEEAVPCLPVRIKHRIVRLQRRTHNDWPAFRAEVESNLDAILAHFDTHALVSICDTYADYGDPVERRNAMMISLITGWEKLAETQRMAQGTLCSDAVDAAASAAITRPRGLGDGITSIPATSGANVLPNLFSRLAGLVCESPVIFRILQTVIDRMRRHEHSTLAFLDRHHELGLSADIAEAWRTARPSVPATLPASSPVSAVSCDSLPWLQVAAEEPRIPAPAPAVGMPPAQGYEGASGGEIAQLHAAVTRLSEEVNRFTRETYPKDAWIEDVRYRDLLTLLGRATMLAPPLEVDVRAERRIAVESSDHRFPRGTAKDNMRAPWFVAKCEKVLGPDLAVLDLGCSGGGLVLDFSLRGHRAVGLEGSDYSLKRGRAEWRILSDRLFTCDITGVFQVMDRSTGERMRFDLVTAWDVLEHLRESDLPRLLANVRAHLKEGGLFVGSISTHPSSQCPDGTSYHATVHPKTAWIEVFRRNGFTVEEPGPFEHGDFPRGNGVSPLYPADFAARPETGFHFVARLSSSAAGSGAAGGPGGGPSRADQLVERGRQAHQSGDGKRARALFAAALEQDPGHLDALNHLGVVLGEQGLLLEAVKHFRRALDIDPGFDPARRNCAALLKANGHEQEAEKILSGYGSSTP